MYSPITAIDVPTRYPTTAFASVGSISAHASTPIAITAMNGTRWEEIRRQIRHPGTAPSRENANIIRDADVTDAVRQNICATTAMKSRNSAQRRLIAVSQMYVTANPPASITPCVSGIAKVTASRSRNPKITETTTDITIPIAAIRDARAVYPATCADASKPVIVYCAISRPIPNTYRNIRLPKFSPENPELLIVSPNTYPAD